MPLTSTLPVLEEIVEADHEETTTRQGDDFDDASVDDIFHVRTDPTTNIEEVTRVLIDEEIEDADDIDDIDDIVFYDNQQVNPSANVNPTMPSSFASSSSSSGAGSNHSNNSQTNLRSSSITSNSSAGGYLQTSKFLEPLVEGDDGDVSMEFHMPDDNNNDNEAGDDDDSANAAQDMEYEDMYGSGSRNMQDHNSTPRLSTFFNSIDRSGTPSSSTSTTPRNSSRQSFVSTASSRRISTETSYTNQSAPPVLMHTHTDGLMDGTDGPRQQPQQRRRVTIQSDHNNTSDNLDSSNSNSFRNSAGKSSLASRSSRFRITSRNGYSSSSSNMSSPGGGGGGDRSTKPSFYGSIINRRRSTRGNPNGNGSGASMYNNSLGDSNGNTSSAMVDAVERLNTYQSSDFEYVSAAAAVVSATASGKRNYVQQFGQGDHVLVILAILGLADAFGNKESYTIDPVNKLGFPRNQGKTEAQNQGPFLYVLCIVKQVHFDEDERYYTVLRCDTNTEQRADPGYMEPIRDEDAIEMAYKASQRSRMNMADENVQNAPNIDFCEQLMISLMQFCANAKRRLIPTYVRTRNGTKQLVQRLLHGESGYALHFRFSGINFLVCCSLLFLFHDVFTLGYLPASADVVMDTIGIAVWAVLIVELFLEFLIRPKHYQDLVRSDKAFAPSTARLLNRFHFVCESLSLLLYIPQAYCVFSGSCFNGHGASRRTLWALTSSNLWEAAAGRFLAGLTFLRSFGLARHWKQMWLNHTYDKSDQEKSFVRQLLFVEKVETSRHLFKRRKTDVSDLSTVATSGSGPTQSGGKSSSKHSSEEDQQLENAASIGTSLMLVNSHRALFIILTIVSLLPALYAGLTRNPDSRYQVHLLQDNNVASNSTEDCEYLFNAVQSWLDGSADIKTYYELIDSEATGRDPHLLWAQLLPVSYWAEMMITNPTKEAFAESLAIRPGAILDVSVQSFASSNFADNETLSEFYVRALYNEAHPIALANASLFLLLASMVIFGLLGLTIMRSDSERLVLSPLQHMLSIVVRYAENPLSTPTSKETRRRHGSVSSQDNDDTEEQLGHYETEQLINAISKIADLLRKCWGVAGAGIISANLARTKDGRTVVFNPTIPGKQIYALFGFIGINDFSKQLRSLEQDVMILINDVARVVHDEVYRWALGDSGQCNKNLGAAFLMVFRIGDFTEVYDKKKKATDVVFDSQLKNEKTRRHGTAKQRRSSIDGAHGRDGSLQLASLPGIQTFADRALLGCLKSFAGLHRDQNMQDWQKDFRLGAGVGNFHISVIYGMDAGWAVEGAVGSEYKIDATYLSPHVNMASRMMSACAQYGVKVLLSQAVEELLSKTARTKLRHLDTVYVKGSNVSQRIYTYDARHEGVDFFLFERTSDQADIEAEAYNPSIWDNDQDLKSMRQHVTDDFVKTFQQGVELYLEGHWKQACKNLEEADNIMFENVVESGFVDYITEDLGEYGKNLNISKDELLRLKNEFGDGACKCLIQYMQRRKFIPPPDWKGVRHLLSK